MANEEEIKNYLKSNNIFNTLDKYYHDDELLILLNIILEEHQYYNIIFVLNKLSYKKEFDEIRQKVLDENINYIDSFDIMLIISTIFDDELKLYLLNKYFDKFDKNFEIAHIINSLHGDKIKINTFKEYIQYYESESFSDYLRKIKDDNLRTSEFLLYKE